MRGFIGFVLAMAMIALFVGGATVLFGGIAGSPGLEGHRLLAILGGVAALLLSVVVIWVRRKANKCETSGYQFGLANAALLAGVSAFCAGVFGHVEGLLPVPAAWGTGVTAALIMLGMAQAKGTALVRAKEHRLPGEQVLHAQRWDAFLGWFFGWMPGTNFWDYSIGILALVVWSGFWGGVFFLATGLLLEAAVFTAVVLLGTIIWAFWVGNAAYNQNTAQYARWRVETQGDGGTVHQLRQASGQ